ncbi:Hypothetical protein D9617_28g065050 [Elsinoe fawcettii]|nr:Hypothetical protein D9617_28g065050 [Elsinoe fawcettii]
MPASSVRTESEISGVDGWIITPSFQLGLNTFTRDPNVSIATMPTEAEVRAIFAPIERGDMPSFFENIRPDVDWTVKGEDLPQKHGDATITANLCEGTFCKISGHYQSLQEFHTGTKALSSTWASPLKLVVQNVIASGNQAAVELKAVDTSCKNGLPFTNEYSWVLQFDQNNKIKVVRAYMDTDLVTRAIEQNPS